MLAWQAPNENPTSQSRVASPKPYKKRNWLANPKSKQRFWLANPKTTKRCILPANSKSYTEMLVGIGWQSPNLKERCLQNPQASADDRGWQTPNLQDKTFNSIKNFGCLCPSPFRKITAAEPPKSKCWLANRQAEKKMLVGEPGEPPNPARGTNLKP